MLSIQSTADGKCFRAGGDDEDDDDGAMVVVAGEDALHALFACSFIIIMKKLKMKRGEN